MDVDEGGLLTVQFNALSDKRLFFYILCLEETGNYDNQPLQHFHTHCCQVP